MDWWLLALACAPPPLELTARTVAGGIEVHGSRPLDRVDALDDRGRPLQRRKLDPPTDTVFLAVEAPTIRVVGWAGAVQQGIAVAAPGGPVRVEVGAGERAVAVADGDVVHLAPGTTRLDLALSATGATRATVRTPGWEAVAELEPGNRWTARIPVVPGTWVEVDSPDGKLAFTAVGEPLAPGAISLVSLTFPADAEGAAERARAPDRIDLPSRTQARITTALGIGWRPRSDLAPWAWQSVVLSNALPEAVDVVVRATVPGDAGEPDPLFDARLREGRSPEVVAVARIPALGQTQVVLPVYVDAEAAPEQVVRRRRIAVLPISGGPALTEGSAPLVVRRAGSVLAIAAVAAVAAIAAGWVALFLRWKAWMRRSTPGELVAIGLLGTLAHSVAVLVQLAGFGVAMFLGPFAPFVTAWADDAVRACLYATLLALYPRSGVVALATLVGSMVRAVVLGAFHPVDLLFLGASVAWLEGGVALAGLDRPGWRDLPPLARWARLSIGLSIGNAGVTATGIAVGAVVYRLFYAGWYVAAMVALPGVAYVAAGCAIAVGFADSLRRVAP